MIAVNSILIYSNLIQTDQYQINRVLFIISKLDFSIIWPFNTTIGF